MKNQILLIAFLLPLLSFAQRQALFIPVSGNISLKLSEGIKVYWEENGRSEKKIIVFVLPMGC
ncbi:MAG: hypothetical protein AAFN10_26270 [Bacteroidota bacterium]